MKKYYSEDVIKDIDYQIVKNPFFPKWYEIVEPILRNDEFQKRKLFPHHHNITVWEHSVLVSFRSFLLGRIFKADERVCAIAGLLHDFYPWSWMYSKNLEDLDGGKYLIEVRTKHSLFKKHGFTHALAASKNYVKYFPELEDKKITNSIKRHMFPLNIIPPRYKEGFIVTLVDKFNSCQELPSIKVVPSKLKQSFDKRFHHHVLKEKNLK